MFKKTIGIIAALMFASSASAATFGLDGGSSLQGILDSITVGGNSSVDVTTDALTDLNDSEWSIGGSGGALSNVIIELAGNATSNTFGIYDEATDQYVELFDGAATTGSRVLVGILDTGEVEIGLVGTGIFFQNNKFNFYLGTDTNGDFFSDTNLNTDGADHMVAYQGVGDQIKIGDSSAGLWGANEYILGWEDLAGGGDKDYNDFVVLVESVNPVSEPATLALFGMGLLGLTFARRNRKA